MKALQLMSIGAAMAAVAASPVQAQSRPVGGGARIAVPSHSGHFSWERGHGFRRGLGGGVWIVEREVPVIVEREVVREVAAPTHAAQPLVPQTSGSAASSPKGEGKRKAYVIGASYASLPASCMKLIEEGVSFYYCSGGEWYRQVGEGRSVSYRAVARKL